MLYWAVVFFITAAVASVFGFGGTAVEATGTARTMSYLFTGLFLVALIAWMLRR